MSYPPPPGLKSSSSTPQPHPSLPARPPPSAVSNSGFKPAFTSSSAYSHGAPGTGGGARPPAGAATVYRPNSVNANGREWQNHSPSVTVGPAAPPSNYPGSSTAYGASQYHQQQTYPSYQQSQNYYQQSDARGYGQPTPPQIQNPFPLPGQGQGQAPPPTTGNGHGRYDPEMEAQIAQWQSAYGPRDEQMPARGNGAATGSASAGGANAVALGTRPTLLSTQDAGSAQKTEPGTASAASGPDGKEKTVIRSGGGQTWQDSSLLEWDPAHFRLFVGNLAGEVTDDSLLKAFSKYDSVQKARVVRDKRTTKSKGFGFVSFSDGDQYFQAVKDMQGKYIGSHPVLLKRSTTEIKATAPVDRNKNKKHRGGKGGGAGGQAGAGGHADTGAGIKKPSKNKTWNGLKILG